MYSINFKENKKPNELDTLFGVNAQTRIELEVKLANFLEDSVQIRFRKPEKSMENGCNAHIKIGESIYLADIETFEVI